MWADWLKFVPDGVAGFTVPPESPHALAEAIIKFYQENLEQKFSEAVQKEKAKYSWDHLVHALEQLIERQNGQEVGGTAI